MECTVHHVEFSLFHSVENLIQKRRILFIFHLEENLTAYTGDFQRHQNSSLYFHMIFSVSSRTKLISQGHSVSVTKDRKHIKEKLEFV